MFVVSDALGWLVLALLGLLALPFLPFIWVGRMDCMQPVRSMVLATLTYGFLGLVLILRLLWWPIKRLGTLIYGDPDWDWILLWNITIPFPKYFPGIFGTLVTRPLTAHEWENIVLPSFIQQGEIPEGPSYDEWLARTIPGKTTPFLDAECWLDAAVDKGTDIQIFCLLILRRSEIHGLLLEHVAGQGSANYRRLGMFSSSRYESCFAWSEEAMKTIVLI